MLVTPSSSSTTRIRARRSSTRWIVFSGTSQRNGCLVHSVRSFGPSLRWLSDRACPHASIHSAPADDGPWWRGRRGPGCRAFPHRVPRGGRCGAGEACSEIDDAFDFAIVDGKLASLNRDLTQDDFRDSPMTTWHDDFDEGFWFSVTTAYHEEQLIDKIVVANLTEKNYKFRIKELVAKIQAGWLPPD